MKPAAILFDFDGVLIDSEWAGNRFIAEHLTSLGFPTRPEDALNQFMGLAGDPFEAAVSSWIGAPFPLSLQQARLQRGLRFLKEGMAEVPGATDFVSSLPDMFPIAVASSATRRWLAGHLEHLGLSQRFGEHLYSGREHVERMKPAPDIYLHAAKQLGVAIEKVLIIEDSPIGIEGAVASGAYVVGLLAGSHVRPGHEEKLLAAGAHRCVGSYAELNSLFL